MENVMNQARLDHSIPHSNFNSSFQNSTFSHQAPPAVPPIHIPETRKSVQIQEIKSESFLISSYKTILWVL